MGKGFNGFKLVQLSDVHMGGWMDADHFAHALELALAQNPNLLALTGDFLEHRKDARTTARALDDLFQPTPRGAATSGCRR